MKRRREEEHVWSHHMRRSSKTGKLTASRFQPVIKLYPDDVGDDDVDETNAL